MPCPWYKNGMCTSPKLHRPSSAVVNLERCMGGPEQYKTCSFYVEPGGESEESNRSTPAITSFTKSGLEKKLKPYPPIHLLDHRPESGCQFLKVYEYSGGFLAYCTILERLLTRSEVKLCESHWRQCPIRKIGMRVRYAASQ